MSHISHATAFLLPTFHMLHGPNMCHPQHVMWHRKKSYHTIWLLCLFWLGAVYYHQFQNNCFHYCTWRSAHLTAVLISLGISPTVECNTCNNTHAHWCKNDWMQDHCAKVIKATPLCLDYNWKHSTKVGKSLRVHCFTVGTGLRKHDGLVTTPHAHCLYCMYSSNTPFSFFPGCIYR